MSEQGYDEPSFELCREMWTEKMAALEEEIKTESEKIKNDPINQEVKMLDYIRDAVDFVTDKKKSDGDADSNGDDAATGGEQMTISDEAEKKAQEQAAQEQAMQTARMQAQQQTLANQSGHRQRISMKAMLEEKKEVVRKKR